MSEKVTYPVLEEGTLAAKLVADENGIIVVTDLDGNNLGEVSVVDNGKTYKLPANPSNRKWFNIAAATKAIDEQGHCDLLYKATRTVGVPSAGKMPHAKLIAYLPDDLQAEYNAIIDEARKLMEADRATRKTAKTAEEKLADKIAKKRAELDNLLAQLGDDVTANSIREELGKLDG